MNRDVNYDKTRITLHCTGADGTTDFPNTAYHPVVSAAAQGSAHVSTAESAFGGGSLVLDGAGYINLLGSKALTPGTQDWTVGGWWWPTNSAAGTVVYSWRFQVLFGTNVIGGQTAGDVVIYVRDMQIGIATFCGGSLISILDSAPVSTGEWIYFEGCRHGSDLLLFVKRGAASIATLVASVNVGSASVAAPSVEMRVGCDSSGSCPAQGYFNDIFYDIGIARHTEAFAPPSTQRPDCAGWVTGTVRDHTGNLCARTVLLNNAVTGELVADPVVSDAVTGVYALASATLALCSREVVSDDPSVRSNLVDLVYPGG